MPQNDVAPDERAPLLSAQPASVGASDEVLDNDDTKQKSKPTISVARGTLCVLALGCLIFLQATNISLLTTTQSSIAADLDAFEKTSWFTSAYLIAMSSTSPLAGRLSQVFSPRICIFASSIILAVGTLISSFAAAFPAFIIGRIFTGVGAAGIFTVSMIIVLELATPARRGLFIGLLNSGFTVGVAAGATIAGALLPHIGWRALFWMQSPVSVAGGTVLLICIPHDFSAGEKDGSSITARLARIDYFGAMSLTASIVLMLFALSSPKQIPILPIVLSIIVLVTFVLNEAYVAKEPIIPITLLKSRGLLLTCLGTVGYMMARWTVLFYTPTYAIAVRNWSPGAAGSILVPTNGGFALGGLLVGWLHIRHHGSFYIPCLIVYTIFPISLVLLAYTSTATSSASLYVLLVFINGATTGAALNYTLAHLLHLIPSDTHYIATSLLATFRGFAGSFGSAIGSGLFTRVLRKSLETRFRDLGFVGGDAKDALVRRLLGSPALVGTLTGAEREVAVLGYEDALKGLWLAGAGLAALVVIVQAGTGWKGYGGKKVLVDEVEDGEARGRDE